MLRILLCVPTTDNLNQIPEIRELTATHSVAVLNGQVTVNDLYQQCKNNFDIIHFGGHGGPDGFQLSATETITTTDIATLCRMSHATILYLNACNMGRVAGPISRRGGHRNQAPRYIIYSQMDLPDKEAWQTPLAFYNELSTQTSANLSEAAILNAYQTADGDGIKYNMLVSTTFLEQLLIEIEHLRNQYHSIELTTKQLIAATAITSAIIATIIIAYLLIT